MNKRIRVSIVIVSLLVANHSIAATEPTSSNTPSNLFATRYAHDAESLYPHPFYFGVTGGYGSTTWDGLVPARSNQGAALNLSTPTDVTEGGAIWGVFVGYELIPFFAIEGSYTHYPNATVNFDAMSLFTFEHNGLTTLTTNTETISLVAKIMMIIPHTTIRAYSSIGAADVHRNDQIQNQWQISPTFGVGFNYNVSEHVMAELGGNYTTGNGESELNPAQDYIPFLYSVFLRVAYRV